MKLVTRIALAPVCLWVLACEPAEPTAPAEPVEPAARTESAAPMPPAEPVVQALSAEELMSRPPAGMVLLDVRTPEEFAKGHVPDARNIPLRELAGRLDELTATVETPIVVYCERGARAAKAGETLLAAGYGNVLHLTGDMKSWREAGHPQVR